MRLAMARGVFAHSFPPQSIPPGRGLPLMPISRPNHCAVAKCPAVHSSGVLVRSGTAKNERARAVAKCRRMLMWSRLATLEGSRLLAPLCSGQALIPEACGADGRAVYRHDGSAAAGAQSPDRVSAAKSFSSRIARARRAGSQVQWRGAAPVPVCHRGSCGHVERGPRLRLSRFGSLWGRMEPVIEPF
jgi:hypothetical protein